mmetsp:Transcript_4728/g.7280  ORF Transcript_4728/g.7280 Transcript_4728/m.7280 type:complete len:254 (-) Transcript_4728:261-1022(-)
MANGRIVYNGSREAASRYFEMFQEHCPVDYSPADYYLQVISDDQKSAMMAFVFKTEFQGKLRLERTKGSIAYPGMAVAASFSTQFSCLLLRKCRQWVRDRMLLGSQILNYVGAFSCLRFAALIMMARSRINREIEILAGLLFGVQYRPFITFQEEIPSGALLFRKNLFMIVLMIAAFTPGFTAIAKFEAERGLLRRETASKRYGLFAHFASLTACSWGVESFSALVFSMSFYFLAGLSELHFVPCLLIMVSPI